MLLKISGDLSCTAATWPAGQWMTIGQSESKQIVLSQTEYELPLALARRTEIQENWVIRIRTLRIHKKQFKMKEKVDK